MAAKGGIAFPSIVEVFVKLVVGLILAAVFLAVAWLAFKAVAGDIVTQVANNPTALAILAGAVVGGVSIVVGATLLSLKK